MKKAILLFGVACLIFCNGISFANTTQKKLPDKKDFFKDTSFSFEITPKMVEDMVKEIENSDELKTVITDFETNVVEQPLVNVDFEDKELTDFLVNRINTNSDFSKKIIIKYGQNEEFAEELSQEKIIREYLGQKVQQDTVFRKEVFSLLSDKEQQNVCKIINNKKAETPTDKDKAVTKQTVSSNGKR